MYCAGNTCCEGLHGGGRIGQVKYKCVLNELLFISLLPVASSGGMGY